MKKHLFLMTIAAAAIAFAGCSKDDDDDSNKTPPYAASPQTYEFGSQTWSDAILCPECNKESFSISETEPQCRSYTADGTTRYYYNWAYVNQNAAKLCPSPWRVPTQSDFEELISKADVSTLMTSWGLSGYAYNSMYNVGARGYLWSSTTTSEGSFSLWYGYNAPSVPDLTSLGFPVRCVR